VSANDGGPAFPWEDMKDTVGEPRPTSGMSLRDWLAGTCPIPDEIPQVVAEALMGTGLPSDTMQQLAWSLAARSKLRFMQADAMLAARKEAE
jgi:hypothetical protein